MRRFICLDTITRHNSLPETSGLYNQGFNNQSSMNEDGITLEKFTRLYDMKNGSVFVYGRTEIKKYYKSRRPSKTARTIAEIASYYGITIEKNFINTDYFRWNIQKLADILSDYWITILADNAMYFITPVRTSISKQITTPVLVNQTENLIDNVQYQDETGLDYTIEAANKTVIPVKITGALKNMALNKHNALKNIVTVQSGVNAGINDYFILNGVIYIIVGKRVEDNTNKVFYYDAVRESNVLYPISGADVICVEHEKTQDAQLAMTGGGNWLYVLSGGTNYIKWSASLIIRPAGRPDATDGYFTIDCPTSGNVNVLAADETYTTRTATSNGIPLEDGEAIYYKIPWGSANTSVQANFLVIPATIPNKVNLDGYVLIAVKNATDKSIRCGNGKYVINKFRGIPTITLPSFTVGGWYKVTFSTGTNWGHGSYSSGDYNPRKIGLFHCTAKIHISNPNYTGDMYILITLNNNTVVNTAEATIYRQAVTSGAHMTLEVSGDIETTSATDVISVYLYYSALPTLYLNSTSGYPYNRFDICETIK